MTTPDPSTMTTPDPSSIPTSSLASLATNGYLHLPAAIAPALLHPLRDAAAHLTSLARRGAWPFVRTLPKQFPPWPRSAPGVPPAPGIWGVQHLLHPDAPAEARTAFARAYFGDEVVGVVRRVLGVMESGGDCAEAGEGTEEKDGRENGGDGACAEDALVMELFNLLVRPDAAFALRWHRDDVPAHATAAEETARLLGQPAWHAQWNLALCDDRSLVVVPGSHRRARTAAERAADAFADDMPGATVVAMRAGDVVFYDNNILHRGVYDAGVERLTLHGSVGHVRGSRERARNVLQHGVGEWVGRCDFEGLEPRLKRRAEGMRARLEEMGRVSGDVGFFSKEE